MGACPAAVSNAFELQATRIMFDILVYLFEHYDQAEVYPTSDQLAHKLSAAGFEQDDISEALEWLGGLREHSANAATLTAPQAGSVRIYAREEMARLNAECRGFLAFLENAGVLSAVARELIIERAMALSNINIGLHRFKVIVLMVLWQQQHPLDMLILDELLADAEDDEEGPVFQ